MSRIAIPADHTVTPEAKIILDNIALRIGFVPNMHRVMALSPAALTG